ncbi:class I poly(R)-hydroxyalkanoic acid synthase [Phenylobacterium sp. LjRoot219]|uniref:PHA/PHB synthase family protein n=1 Tax=Phenylobacterium sp. LjRoot219 TaxID=3342283 RepID=UPI003ED04E66
MDKVHFAAAQHSVPLIGQTPSAERFVVPENPVETLTVPSSKTTRKLKASQLALEREAASFASHAASAETLILLANKGPAASDGRAASPAPFTPLFNPDPLNLWPALWDGCCATLTSPQALQSVTTVLVQTGLDLWTAWLGALVGAEAPRDRRFSEAAWTQPGFDLHRRLYSAAGEGVRALAGALLFTEPLHEKQVNFFASALVDAAAPSNFLATNPVAIETALNTNGESLLRGARNFASDLERGGGRLAISQTDASRFQLGENIATTPGKVVFRNELLELLQFSPATAQVHAVPLVIITPVINKYYIIDLRPENSLVRWLTEQGFTVFVTSWVNPDEGLADKGLEAYMRQGVLTALLKAMEQTGQPKVNAVGYCIGGTMLAATMAYLEALEIESPIASATFFAAQQDFSRAGDLQVFCNDAWIADAERLIDRSGGILPGQAMASAFNHLRPRDLVWSYVTNNYLLGKTPRPFDLLYWNSDATRLPKRLHLGYLREFYQKNAFARGELEIDGVRVDLGKVRTPVYVQASKEDHIAPFDSVYRGARLFGGEVIVTLAGSGHIAGVINHPAVGKYQHWTNAALPETAEAWFAAAEEHPGSWWPHWAAWLAPHSGEMVPARDPAAGPLGALAEAPGDYVRVRA